MIKKIIAFILVLACSVLPTVSCSLDALMGPVEEQPKVDSEAEKEPELNP